MTDLRDPESPAGATKPGSGGEAPPVPVLLGALTTTAWAVTVTVAPLLLIVLLAWVVAPVSPVTPTALDAVRFALATWLLAHGAPIHVGGGVIGLAPLGLSLAAVWQVARAATKTARAVGAADVRAGGLVALAVAGVYCLLGGVIALIVDTSSVQVSPWLAMLGTGTGALAASAWGVCRIPGVLEGMRRLVPDPVPTAVREGALGALGLLGAATVVALGAIASESGRAVALGSSLHAGPVGTVALVVLCVLYLPTVVGWAAAYVVGPGFAVGAGTTVNAFAVHLGPIPAFPLLAGLPAAPASPLARCLVLLPMAVGVVLGVRAARAAEPGSWRAMLGAAALRGPVMGVLIGLTALASSGPLGTSRLAAIGPSAWRIALVCVVEVALAAVVAAAGQRGIDAALRWHRARV
jgi:hypothetical protein